MNDNTRKESRCLCGARPRRSSWIVALLALAGSAWAAAPAYVPVGDEGNARDAATGLGDVGYAYRIGVHEVTRAEYAAFLNAVAAADAQGLYNPNMGIVRSGSPGSYVYAAAEGTRSVAWVSWYDALRFANWLHNGQPGGAAGPASTETGAYTFSGATGVSGRNPGARVFMPNENEWYKAAYYQGGTDAWYWRYPTRSDAPPLASAPSAGDNAANYDLAVGGTTAAGSYPATRGYYGTHDQAGNLWEWNETELGGGRGLRGGSYDDYPLLLHASYRDSQDPADENEFVGFRVAAVAGSAPPVNRAPVGSAESYAVDEAATLTAAAPGVLANDTDADGDALTAALVAGPAHGTLALNANGSFTYTPAENYTGPDSFSYKPNDGLADGNSVTVSIAVRAVLYALTVGSGSGDGSYAYGTVVALQADPPAAGMLFDRWTGDTASVANVTAASTTLTMQRRATAVTATYKAAASPAFDITLAEWSSRTRYLKVRGKAPPRKKVVVTDQSGRKVGAVTSKSDGSWYVLRSVRQAPVLVRATCNGMTDEMPVTRK